MPYFNNHLIKKHSFYKSFEYFWLKFHYQNKQYKKGDKSRAKELFEKMFLDQKIKAFDNMEGCSISAYDFLKTIQTNKTK